MKIIFNHLPPARIDQPSSSFSILQHFLRTKGYDSKVIYWNIRFSQTMIYYGISHDYFRNLIPFLALLAEEFKDFKIKNLIVSYLQTIKPFYKTKPSFYTNSIDDIINQTRKVIETELTKEENEADLYGISTLFLQWIPGRLLAKMIKQKYPFSKIVIGGLSSRNAAIAMLKKVPEFDYAIWGEGEYPLLDLCRHIENKSVKLNDIQRLVYRSENEIVATKPMKWEYIDFNNYIFPDLSDYFAELDTHNIPRDSIMVLLNTIRGCRWNKCSFCTYSNNQIFRERTPENIFNEIKQCYEKYGVSYFYFSDNEMVGRDVGRFERLLDLLIDFKNRVEPRLKLFGEMIPSSDITEVIFQKMSKAGFKYLYIGYESISDTLLRKMKKENTFSENILFVKLSMLSNINLQVNIIQQIPTETEEDIIESINNLHFMRFLFHVGNMEFEHKYITLNLYKNSEYYRKLSENEIEQYTINPLVDMIPKSFISDAERWDFFSFRKQTYINNLWSDFLIIEQYYKKNRFTCKVTIEDNGLIYSEFINNELVKSIPFYQMWIFDILFLTEQRIENLTNLSLELNAIYPNLTLDEIIDALNILKSNYLIYFTPDFNSIISVIFLNRKESD
jgi:radical SAM superfamily enzyme YgiQ (UPF0313 family)